MTTPSLHQQLTPDRFLNAVNAYELTEAIKTAIELEIFTAIAEDNTTSAMIARRCKATERGVRILCDFLTIHSFLTKDGTHYGLAPDSALFLEPAFAGVCRHHYRVSAYAPVARVSRASDRSGPSGWHRAGRRNARAGKS